MTKPTLADFNADGYMDLLIEGMSLAGVGPYDVAVFAASGPNAPPPSARLMDESIQKFYRDVLGYLKDPNYFNGAYQRECDVSWSTFPDWRWDIDYYQYYYYNFFPVAYCYEVFSPNYSYPASAAAPSI